MHPLELYYRKQAVGRGGSDHGIGPIYSTPPYLQRAHGIGDYFGSLFRWVRNIIWSGVKALGRETLRTGGDILSDIAEAKPTTSLHAKDIVSKLLNESKQNLINKLGGRGRKRKGSPAKSKRKTNKNAKITKRDIFS
jgi:hypothetical protein